MNKFDYEFPVRIHFGQGYFEESLKQELQKYGQNVISPLAAVCNSHPTRSLKS